jgi:hypothetical protein
VKIRGVGRLFILYLLLKSKINIILFRIHYKTILKSLPNRPKIPFHFVSFSGAKTFYDQLLSILSFYYNVGSPISWTIYSDGTYSPSQISIFYKFNFVKLVNWDSNLKIKYKGLLDFGKKFIWGNRLHAYLNHTVSPTTIFLDSDILFYKGFSIYLSIINKSNWYIQDTGPHLDKYYFTKYKENDNHFINAGFLVINESPNWGLAVDYIVNRNDKDCSWEHFTEQAAINYMIKNDSTFHPLSEEKFILSCKDSFDIYHKFDIKKIALRHYVSPVRHKMWQYPWKKILGIQ